MGNYFFKYQEVQPLLDSIWYCWTENSILTALQLQTQGLPGIFVCGRMPVAPRYAVLELGFMPINGDIDWEMYTNSYLHFKYYRNISYSSRKNGTLHI